MYEMGVVVGIFVHPYLIIFGKRQLNSRKINVRHNKLHLHLHLPCGRLRYQTNKTQIDAWLTAIAASPLFGISASIPKVKRRSEKLQSPHEKDRQIVLQLRPLIRGRNYTLMASYSRIAFGPTKKEFAPVN
jgi:hypothetical protein